MSPGHFFFFHYSKVSFKGPIYFLNFFYICASAFLYAFNSEVEEFPALNSRLLFCPTYTYLAGFQ